MGHLLKYRLIQTIRERSILFWTIAFPMILGTFFFMAFGSLAKHETVATQIPVAIISSEQTPKTKAQISFLKQMQKQKLIDIQTFKSSKASQQALEDGKIEGIYDLEASLRLDVTKSDVNTSILKEILDSYNRHADLITEMSQSNPEKLSIALASLKDLRPAVKAVAPNGRTTSGFLQPFLTLIAYACLSGMFLGVKNSFDTQANLSTLGARRSLTPTSKLHLIIVDFITVLTVDFVSVLLLTLLLTRGFGLNLGQNLLGLVLTVLMGCVIGVSIGIVLGASNQASIHTKMGLSVLFTLLPSFLAGMMFQNMGLLVEQYAPIINRVNPAAVLADAFYCLSVYDNPARYSRDMMTLLIMSIGCLAIAFIFSRRERYDSI